MVGVLAPESSQLVLSLCASVSAAISLIVLVAAALLVNPLVTAFVGFATLYLVPIPMIRELSITASIGVAYKIVTNLVMLPVVASFFRFGPAYVARITALLLCGLATLDAGAQADEARARKILDSMFAFVGLFSKDGRLLEANEAPLAAAGLTREARQLGYSVARSDSTRDTTPTRSLRNRRQAACQTPSERRGAPAGATPAAC